MVNAWKTDRKAICMDIINDSNKLFKKREERQREVWEHNMEEVFQLMYYGRFTYEDAMDLPFDQRKWFLQRTQEEVAKK